MSELAAIMRSAKSATSPGAVAGLRGVSSKELSQKHGSPAPPLHLTQARTPTLAGSVGGGMSE